MLVELGKVLAGRGSFVPPYVMTWERLILAGDLLLPGSWILFGRSQGHSAPSGYTSLEKAGGALLLLFSGLFFVVLTVDLPLPESIERGRVEVWFFAYMIVALTFALSRFEATLRAADRARRWRIKYLLLGVGAILAVRIFAYSQRMLFPAVAQDFSVLTSSAVLMGGALIAFSLIRHQILDVDVFVSRYFVYGSFTVVAVGAYLLAVGFTAGAIRLYGGSFASYWGVLFVLVSAILLLAALLSTTVQKKVKMFINRHFFRNRYDYHREWLTLTEKLSSRIEAKELVSPIAELFSETLWVDRTVIWLCDDAEEEFHVLVSDGREKEKPARWSPEFTGLLKSRDYPIPVDELTRLAGSDLPDLAPVERFRSEGISVLVPLIAGKRLVGVMGLGKARSGYSMDGEDLELINTVAGQAASSFLIARMSQSLVRAKEMEAFHAFSAFVLHDMKNFVSMLSLVVQNADRNLDNPEFRKDALRSVSQTVEKMKRMMERLSALSRGRDLQGETVDLDGLVKEVAAELNGSVRSRIVEYLDGPPPVFADPVEIRKVVTNLILNADEAMARDGEIRLATFSKDGRSVLSVSDSGCGMTPEFVEGSLFKPFATTKSQGFGIGLYQVKRIVDAHEGIIEVDSAVGRGTTVRVLLPQAGG